MVDRRRQPRPKMAFRLLGVRGQRSVAAAVALACGVQAGAVGAQGALSAQPQAAASEDIRIWAQEIEGIAQQNVRLRGQAELRQGWGEEATTVQAPAIDYEVPTDTVRIHTGDAQTSSSHAPVRIWHGGQAYQVQSGTLQLGTRQGSFEGATFQMLNQPAGGHGRAARVQLAGPERSIIHDALYTTCRREDWIDAAPEQQFDDPNWQPDWQLSADSVELNHQEEVGTARGAVLRFKGVPILAAPVLSFPLSDARKTGFLPPTIGVDSTNGFEWSQPYYWNIAPNYDATLTPTLMARRGLGLAVSGRYLLAPWGPQAQPTAWRTAQQSGTWALHHMSDDRLHNGRERWGVAWTHAATLYAGSYGSMGFNAQLRRVSDDDYWRDFSERSTGDAGLTGSRLLESVATLGWTHGGHAVMLRAQKWQTLQDDDAPIAAPFGRMPQLHWSYGPQHHSNALGLRWRAEADITQFTAIDRVGAQRIRHVNAQNGLRSYGRVQISRPFHASWGFIEPQMQLHAAHYRADDALRAGRSARSVVVPTFGLDAGLVFERPAQLFGRSFIQTLEPRAFYTYTPYRDQSWAPLYDTALSDFNLASIYSSNSYTGHDRVADNHMVTVGVTTRWLDEGTGSEVARLGLAQRLRLDDQRVTLGHDVPGQRGWSDVLIGAGLSWQQRWALDALVQYNQDIDRTVRSSITGRYTPGPFRTVSAAYRYQRANSANLLAGNQASEQIDLSWQWPLSRAAQAWTGEQTSSTPSRTAGVHSGGRWYTVGRLNYNMHERKLIDAALGFEYHSCCWATRVVLEREQTSRSKANTRVLLQLELGGFSRLNLGANPLSRLQEYVGGYRDTSATRQPLPASWYAPAAPAPDGER